MCAHHIVLQLEHSILLTVITLALLSACGGSPPPASAAAVVNVRIVPVVRRSIQDVVSGTGDLYPLNEADISPKISAPVQRFFVMRGDSVRKGELLAVLENHDLSAAVSAAQGAVSQAQASLAHVKTTAIPEQLQSGELQLRQAKANLDAQQELYKSRLWLYQQHALARKQLDQAEVALTDAKAQYQAARTQLRNYRADGATDQLRSAQGQLQAARGQLRSSQAKLQFTELHSPIDGVVSDISVFPGAIAAAGTPLITVMNVTSVVARLHVPQPQAELLKIGDPGTIQVPGLKRGAPGTVTVISPALDPNSTTVEVWLDAPNPHGELKPGTAVNASIVAQVIRDALAVPDRAILMNSNGSKAVMTVRDGRAFRRNVVTGIEHAGFTQIESGLTERQQVIVSGGYGLPDGTKVKTAPATS